MALPSRLRSLSLTREQLIDVAILVGTDFNDGVKGIGPKKGAKLIREIGSLDNAPEEVRRSLPENLQEIREFFLDPPVDPDPPMARDRTDEAAVQEVSTGFWCFEREALFDALAKVTTDNAQGEYYLPDVVPLLAANGARVETLLGDRSEILGVNDRKQLAEAARILRERKLDELMAAGVTIEDPAVTYVDMGVEVGPDTLIRPLTFLEGSTRIGSDCTIGPSARLVDSDVDDGAEVSFAVLKSVEVGPGAQVGPFSSLRAGTRLRARAKAGSFVEMKSTTVGEGSKVPHLSYIGDAEIGDGVNIGAGSITCNYDGEAGIKSKTRIGNGVLLGSDTMLVAPVVVHDDAITGAGSVVTRDVEPATVVVGAPARPIRKRKARAGDQ